MDTENPSSDRLINKRSNLIINTGCKILEWSHSPSANIILLRDIIDCSPDDPCLILAKRNLLESRWVRLLQAEQHADGSWGRFHSRDSQSRQKTLTTEFGVQRALALGLDGSDPVLIKAEAYILEAMKGEREFPDPPEKNDRWETGKRLFLAATLAQIDPSHPELDEDRALWGEVARLTFKSGEYQAEDEIAAHKALTGASVKNSSLRLRSKYALEVLGSKPGTISEEVKVAMVGWVWSNPEGIGYLSIPLHQKTPSRAQDVDRWLESIERLSRQFPISMQFAQESIRFLWNQRNEDGLWDFGTLPSASPNLPLADDWREKDKRICDWSVRVLRVLKLAGEYIS